jgi:hypothetical protein
VISGRVYDAVEMIILI